MKKKLIGIAAVLMLLCTVPARAESLFPPIPNTRTEKAPSYAVLMDVSPLREEYLEDGSMRQVYGNVTEENFLQYGEYLNEKGYSLSGHQYVNDSIVAEVEKGSIFFQVTFDWEKATLTVDYPKGIPAEPRTVENPFAGYTEVKFGDKIKFKGFVEMELKGMDTHRYRVENGRGLMVSCKNLTTKSLGADEVFERGENHVTAAMHYINEDNHFMWDVADSGRPKQRGTYPSGLYVWVFMTPAFGQMETADIVAVFSVPDDAYNSSDGILAITFTYGTNQYVLYLHGGE